MANPFVHVELNTTDVAKAKNFYGKLFDWKMEDVPMDDGGAYTMITDRGLMVRVSGREVEAIGKTPAEVPGGAEVDALTKEKVEEAVWEQLKTCFDPEIPVNIVDLGLVYQCELEEVEDGKFDIKIKMTLTAPGCGMGPVLASDVKMKVESIPGVRNAEIEVVFDPVWDRSMMSDAAKLQLGMM